MLKRNYKLKTYSNQFNTKINNKPSIRYNLCMDKKPFKNLGMYLLVLILFLGLRTSDLGTDITNTDAIRWYKRSNNFLRAIREERWEDTFEHYQPGVSLMWANSITKHILQLNRARIGEGPLELNHTKHYKIIHGYSKGVLITGLTMLLGYQMFLISNILNKKVAFGFGLLMAVSPFLIGIDRFFHLTSLETYLTFASFLTLLWWDKKLNDWLVILSGVLFGAALLTKTSALIFSPIALLILIKSEKPIKNIFLMAVASSLTFILLFPALWFRFDFILRELIGGITGGIAADIRKTGVFPLLFYPIILIYKLSPLTLILIGAALINVKKLVQDKNIRRIGLYFLIYLAALTASVKKIDRYIICFNSSYIVNK